LRKAALLIDFGSTYTKVTAVDVEREELLGTAQSYTTVETDIGDGLQNALDLLEQKTGKLDFILRQACSSAAGGLKMCASGLVPELTGEAARLAALGAGAKVARTFAFQLTKGDMAEMEAMKPDILLLTGGTDGGDYACIVHNARMVAESSLSCPIILAGNRSCAEECAEILQDKEVHVTKNVMPRFNELDIAPAQECIREIFMERIVRAKGLSRAEQILGGIAMPTPAAVHRALELLSRGTEEESGLGDLAAVDLGGATTDVYSMCDGGPRQPNTVINGLVEPYAKRSVEGDIGMRYSVRGILENAGAARIAKLAGMEQARAEEMIEALAQNPERLPQTPEDAQLDAALASMAVQIAMDRHAGTLESICTPVGWAYSQTGKDLRDVATLVLTGGALIRSRDIQAIAPHAFYSKQSPMSLRPLEAQVLVDSQYILAAMGLLSISYPRAALRLMKKEMKNYGTMQQKAE
jgi:uncharacterized protein (TIGR01319 family)